MRDNNGRFVKGDGEFRGRHHSIETKEKLRLANIGKKLSEEHKLKIKNSCKGINKGKKSEETKNKISLSKKGIPSKKKGIKTGIIPKSAFKKGTYTKAMRKGSLAGAKSLSERSPTSIEIKLYKELSKRGVIFESQKLINSKFLVDAYIPSLNLVIEADGDYWHSLDRVVKKDKAENAYLKKCGYNIIRLSEKEINDGRFISLLKEVY